MLINMFDASTGKVKKFNPNAHPVRRISVILAKPTKACNADCSYCFAKPYDRDRWTIDRFKAYFDKIEPYLQEPVQWIWHGGEPMLMGVAFYREAERYARKSGLKINFSMQSNLTLFQEDKWLSYIKNDINQRISTSYDIDEVSRTISGNSEKYNDRFFGALDTLMDNRITPFVIGVFDDSNIDQASDMYALSKKYEEKYGVGLDFRINPKVDRFGEGFSGAFQLDPVRYGQKLVELLDDWLDDKDANFTITPIDSFIRFYFNHGQNTTCPWTNKCAGTFLNIEPNGDVYNCDDMVHYTGFDFKYGNLDNDSMEAILSSDPLKELTTRMHQIDPYCAECEFYYACRGGCGALSQLNKKVGDGRYPYCATNKIIFGHIKSLSESGRTEDLLRKVSTTLNL
ncbi:radical SAM protein [Photobacterium galatheae]|uniref:4Fe4S-binding SPASM domain-containing protein n=1 Tax=Photobacterium galatheae TaxID=1654360 RepID=A0A066RHZ5_9GAMM|nr:radical SAM protein [Photobacterium galatheae]KDM89949.1 hypothetical protein EA58_19590 [Photobacterium galatheae]MCM0149256.1 radical SAM protein [Photobacterium galatheae]